MSVTKKAWWANSQMVDSSATNDTMHIDKYDAHTHYVFYQLTQHETTE